MAAHQKKCRDLNATLGFADESGFLLAPLARASLARQGHTPILRQHGRYRHKLSVAAALTLSPGGFARLYYQTYPDLNVDSELYAQFLGNLLWHVRRPLVLLHDGGKFHQGTPVAALQARVPRLHLYPLPPYAPELNPVEYVWTDSKSHKLANFLPLDVGQLEQALLRVLEDFRHDQHRLHSFFARSPLPWEPWPLLF